MRYTVALGTLAALAVAMAAHAQGEGSYYGHSHMWDGAGWWMFLGPLWMILVFGALIAGIVLLVRWLGSPHGGGSSQAPNNRALDILKERFARGEIDKEEFEERRRLLE